MVEPTVDDKQVQIAHSIHDARDWVSATLPGPVGDAVNDALFLVRRLVLPTGEHVGIHGTAECVAAKDCSGKDLTGAQHHDEDLNGVDFTGADLTHANFQNAVFSPSATAAGLLPAASTTLTANAVIQPGANLSGADLSGADLRNANMTGMNLTGANLTNANLTKANLNGAILTNANLTGANFTWASLVNANLSGASPSGAYFGGANLSGAIGNTASYHFRVQLGTVAMSVQEASGLDLAMQQIDVRPSSSSAFGTIKMPGLVKLGTVTLRNGVFTSGDRFSDWFNKIGTGTSPRETLTITLIDEFGQTTMTWTLTNAFPAKINGAMTEGNETAFATVEIAHEGLNITNA